MDVVIFVGQVGLCVYILYRLICWFLTSCTVGDWDTKYVLITGCDSGFGRELALRLDDKGFKVIACCLFEQNCEELRGSGSGSITALQLDVADQTSVERVRTALLTIIPEKTGLWGLVNNAGIVGSPSPLLLNTAEDIKRCLNINTLGQLHMAQACFPMLREAGGRVVNMSSMNGTFPLMFLPYSLSKYGVEIMSDLMRREFRPFGISVSLVEPGANPSTGIQLDTKAFNRSFEAAPQYIKDVFGEGYDVECIKGILGSEKKRVGDRSPKVVKVKKHHNVTDAYMQALTSRFPYARYVVGIDNRIFVFLHWILPVYVFDALIGKILELGLKMPKPASLLRKR